MTLSLKTQLVKARAASKVLSRLDSAKKNAILKQYAESLIKNVSQILRANESDFEKLPREYPHTDRLSLTQERITAMAESVRAIAHLPDPTGIVLEQRTLKNGLKLRKVSVPLGVLGIIYESRPNATSEIFSLTMKSGNAVVLKGGPEAYESNKAIVSVIHQILEKNGVPTASVVLLDPAKKEWIRSLMRANGLVDVLIPRGSNRLIEAVRKQATIPVIETGAGVCHVYVEKTARLDWATKIVLNAKTRRVSVCNALDTLVIDRPIARKLLALLASKLTKKNVILHADSTSYALLRAIYPKELLVRARRWDFGREFLSMAMAIKIVPDYKAATKYIAQYTSGHSEAIVTSDTSLSEDFVNRIDAAALYVNAPTSFTDGFEFGLGGEIGISTQKLHARGPMGLQELTTYKWIMNGQGQIRP